VTPRPFGGSHACVTLSTVSSDDAHEHGGRKGQHVLFLLVDHAECGAHDAAIRLRGRRPCFDDARDRVQRIARRTGRSQRKSSIAFEPKLVPASTAVSKKHGKPTRASENRWRQAAVRDFLPASTSM